MRLKKTGFIDKCMKLVVYLKHILFISTITETFFLFYLCMIDKYAFH